MYDSLFIYFHVLKMTKYKMYKLNKICEYLLIKTALNLYKSELAKLQRVQNRNLKLFLHKDRFYLTIKLLKDVGLAS